MGWLLLRNWFAAVLPEARGQQTEKVRRSKAELLVIVDCCENVVIESWLNVRPQDEGMVELQSLIRLHKFNCQTQRYPMFWSVVTHLFESSR